MVLPSRPTMVPGRRQGVQDRLLGGLHHAGEEAAHLGVVQDLERGRRTRRDRCRWRRRSPGRRCRGWRCRRCGPCRRGRACTGAGGCTGISGASVAATMSSELPGVTGDSSAPRSGRRSVSRRPTGTPFTRSCGRRPKFACTRRPTVYSPAPPRADGDAARGGADARLELEGAHAGAAAHGALGHRPARGPVQGPGHVSGAQVAAGGVVQEACPGLPHHGVRPEGGLEGGRVPVQGPADGAVVGAADAAGVGEQDGGGQDPGAAHRSQAGELAVAVDRQVGGEDRPAPGQLRARQDGGDAGAHGTAAYDEGGRGRG